MVAELQAFSGDAAFTTLTEPVDDAATTIYVASTDGWPGSGTGFTVTLDQYPDGQQISADLQETVFVRSYVGTTVTLDSVKGRGYDNTTAQSHVASAPVVHTLDAMFVNDLSARAFAVSTKGDIAYVGATSGVEMTRLPIGTDYQVIGADPSGVPVYQDSSKSLMTTTGDLLVAGGANAPERLPIGAAWDVLTVVGGEPAWGASGLTPIAKSANYTAVAGNLVNATASMVLTSPAAVAGATFGGIANFAASSTSALTIVAASGEFVGPGIPPSTISVVLGATNANLIFVSDGTNWIVTSGAQDSGWVTPSFLNSWGAATNVELRLVGNRVTIRGSFITPGASGTPAFAFPAGFAPPANAYFPVSTFSTTYIAYGIAGSGGGADFSIVYAAGAPEIIVDGISYLVD